MRRTLIPIGIFLALGLLLILAGDALMLGRRLIAWQWGADGTRNRSVGLGRASACLRPAARR